MCPDSLRWEIFVPSMALKNCSDLFTLNPLLDRSSVWKDIPLKGLPHPCKSNPPLNIFIRRTESKLRTLKCFPWKPARSDSHILSIGFSLRFTSSKLLMLEKNAAGCSLFMRFPKRSRVSKEDSGCRTFSFSMDSLSEQKPRWRFCKPDSPTKAPGSRRRFMLKSIRSCLRRLCLLKESFSDHKLHALSAQVQLLQPLQARQGAGVDLTDAVHLQEQVGDVRRESRNRHEVLEGAVCYRANDEA